MFLHVQDAWHLSIEIEDVIMNKYSCATTVAGVLAPQSAINSRYLMRVNSQSCRFLPVILAVLVLVAGCATMSKEDTKAEIEQWKCGDYFSGCGFFATDCVMLIANLHYGFGEVKFGEIVNLRYLKFRALNGGGIGVAMTTEYMIAPL